MEEDVHGSEFIELFFFIPSSSSFDDTHWLGERGVGKAFSVILCLNRYPLRLADLFTLVQRRGPNQFPFMSARVYLEHSFYHQQMTLITEPA